MTEPTANEVIDESSLADLPAPVARSLRHAGVVGRTLPQRVGLSQRGEILLWNRWFPLAAEETYTLKPPAFEWNATVRLAGLPIARAKDSIADGRGRMNVRLFNLFSVVDATGAEMDQGTLLRWLNETMWFPHVWATDVIRWEPIDEGSAIGRVSVDQLTVEAEFVFDAEGRLIDFRADRYRVDGDNAELMPWRTPLSDYGVFGGVEVPVSGSAIWELATGDLEYIRLQITDLRFE